MIDALSVVATLSWMSPYRMPRRFFIAIESVGFQMASTMSHRGTDRAGHPRQEEQSVDR